MNYSGNVEDFKKFLAEKATLAEKQSVKWVQKVCQKVEATSKQIMRDSPTDSSKSYGKHKHHPSFPNNPPSPDTGALMRSVTHSVNIEGDRAVGYVGSILDEYPRDLEFGTSKMQPRPWLSASLEQNRDWIKNQWQKFKGGNL